MEYQRLPLQPDEIDRLAQGLSRLDTGRQPFPIFKEMTRIMTVPVVELVSFKQDKHRPLEVLLTRRDEHDIFWPNMLHIPGTVILATDTKGDREDPFAEGMYDGPLLRLLAHEMEYRELIGRPEFVGNVHRETARGSEAVVVFAAELAHTSSNDAMYPIDDLPNDIIDVHYPLITSTAKRFRQIRS